MSIEVKRQLESDQWRAYSEVYAFVGNELLLPMNRSGSLQGLDPSFWGQAPVPGNEKGRHGLQRLGAYAQEASRVPADSEDPNVPGMLGASVEYAHLFIGPPKPAADPWETTNDPRNTDKVGFGNATLAMKRLLAEEGLELAGQGNQFEDHMGVELLYLSALCDKCAQNPSDSKTAGKAAWFIKAHPCFWMARFRKNVDAARPDGYYSALLEYVDGVLEDQFAGLTAA